MHLIHFDFFEAFEYNMMGFIVFPILAAFWAVLFFKEVKQFRRLLNGETEQEKYI